MANRRDLERIEDDVKKLQIQAAAADTVVERLDTTLDKILTEDNLYQLELTSFMNLIETDQTKDRIRHTLATGKPLVN